MHFEFVSDADPDSVAAATAVGAVGRPVSFRLPAVHKLSEGEMAITEQLVDRYKIPEKHR